MSVYSLLCCYIEQGKHVGYGILSSEFGSQIPTWQSLTANFLGLPSETNTIEYFMVLCKL